MALLTRILRKLLLAVQDQMGPEFQPQNLKPESLFASWLRDNKLTSNVEKLKFMIIGSNTKSGCIKLVVGHDRIWNEQISNALV